jgi:hypothetical protein
MRRARLNRNVALKAAIHGKKGCKERRRSRLQRKKVLKAAVPEGQGSKETQHSRLHSAKGKTVQKRGIIGSSVQAERQHYG